LLADDWPQWLGPNRDSVWRETGIVEKFPAAGPPVRWRTPIGGGYSGPVVAAGRVYLTDRQLADPSFNPADPLPRAPVKGGERVLCLNETDGAILWRRAYECPYTMAHPLGPRVAPLVSAGRLYSLGAEGNLLCLDAADGRLIWSRDFKRDFAAKTPRWGVSAHPLLDGNRLISLVGGPGTTVVAFDKDTGQEVWRALTAAEPGYSSPVIYDAGGKRQLIVWHPEAVNSLDPLTGQASWSVPFRSRNGLCVATPRLADGRLLVTSFFSGALMLRLDPARPAATTLWRTERGTETATTHLNALISTPFLENGCIYGVCSYGQLRCLDADSGKRLWETFQPTTGGAPVREANAFLVKNGDRCFLFNEKGDLIIARLTPAGYQELSRAHLLEPTNPDPGRRVVFSHPAFANRRIYARNDKEIICVDLAAH
jgi:outer membrane protein assembly factor BamB